VALKPIELLCDRLRVAAQHLEEVVLHLAARLARMLLRLSDEAGVSGPAQAADHAARNQPDARHHTRKRQQAVAHLGQHIDRSAAPGRERRFGHAVGTTA
jgi:hypothetical protein